MQMLKKESALKKQVKAQEGRADTLRESICGKKAARNALEEGMYSVKTLEDLKGEESRLERLNKEDQANVEDEDAAPFDKEAAQELIEARNEEFARLQARIEEGEVALPLRERIKEIFKTNGVTLTAILLATGVTIGIVVGTITNALKAIGKALGSGLKNVGSKVGSILPGLIGSIASFLFKTAGQAIGYIAEDTWLLILAAVFFVAEKYLKKR